MAENFSESARECDYPAREEPGNRREPSPNLYDIEADWILMSTCNFRCEYCFWTPDKLARRISPPASVERLASFFDRTGLTWLLHLTGGEPFIYPGFVDLCNLLTKSHWISINTNADASQRIERFARTTDPERVSYINAGLHIEQREKRRRVDAFLSNVRLFQANRFKVFATSVMHPSVFARFDSIWDYCEEQGVVLIPKAFQGDHCGRNYPQSYTEEQRDVFRQYSTRAADAYRDMFLGMPELPTINPLLDAERFLYTLPDYRGAACLAGHRFVRIREDGEIRRCGSGDVLGNVVTGSFVRRSGPSICEWVECPYFCEKYALRQTEKARRPLPTIGRDNLLSPRPR
jgi:organic radical activating enzyme